MTRPVIAAIDGSPASRAAADWAAREAELRDLPLRIVQAWEPLPDRLTPATGSDVETLEHWSGRVLRAVVEEVAARHPGLTVTGERVAGRPAEALPRAAEGAELLVLGSRGLGRLGGFLVGSVGHGVVASSGTPVVLVRAGESAADEYLPAATGDGPGGGAAFRPVVLGLDTEGHGDTVTAFAFEEAARRDTSLRVLHAWTPPPYTLHGLSDHVSVRDELAREYAADLSEALRPWREKYPAVEVIEASRAGSAADQLVSSSRYASLVVVGRRTRRSPLGVHIGPVAHAVLHHAVVPVAVVAHG